MFIGAITGGVTSLWQKAKKTASNIFSSKEARVNKVTLHSPDKPREKCGIFGIFGKKNFLIGDSLYSGMNSIQNRGQDACGFIYSYGNGMVKPQYKVGDTETKKGGLVADLFQDGKAQEFARGLFGIGHTLYATSRNGDNNIKPHPIVMGEGKNQIALVHNGNLPDLTKLKSFLITEGYDKKELNKLNDSGLMTKAIHHFYKPKIGLKDAIMQAKKYFVGAYAVIVMSRDEMAVLRDPTGVRPLLLGKDDQDRVVVSSETHSFDALGGKAIREIKPGELLIINQANAKRDFSQIAPEIIFDKVDNKQDMMEDIYFKHPQSKSRNKKYVSEVRRDFGKELAKEFKTQNPEAKVDVVIPVPESGIPAATGFAEAMSLPINPALVKNFHRRTFLDDGKKVRAKFALISDAIKGKNIALVDDSIVKGNTSRALVDYVKEAKPKSVHFLSASPPLSHPDFYGVDIPEQKNLIAYQHKNDVKKIAKDIGADSVTYLSIPSFAKAIGVPEGKIELSKANGKYSIPIGKRTKEVDFFLEQAA